MTKYLSLVLFFVSTSAFALDLPINKNLTELTMPSTFTVNYDFEGIVALSNCSGSLIQLEGVSDANNALIMTNGHCVEGGFTNPNEFNYKKSSSRTFTLLNATAGNAGKVTATQLVYSTMTKTDVAIYKLRETYSEIKAKFGIRPMTLSSKHPEVNTSIEVISGYWKRGYSCGIETFINQLKESGWTWTDSMRYSRPGCETIGGTSGSPVVEAGTKTVIGINNTGNEDGQRCSMNNPCEVDANGNISFTQGYSYGQQTFQIYSCLTTTNEIDLAVEGCALFH